jgi:hypothetical protein
MHTGLACVTTIASSAEIEINIVVVVILILSHVFITPRILMLVCCVVVVVVMSVSRRLHLWGRGSCRSCYRGRRGLWGIVIVVAIEESAS